MSMDGFYSGLKFLYSSRTMMCLRGRQERKVRFLSGVGVDG